MQQDYDPDDRFGVSEQLIIDVMKAHYGLIRDGCYVPTRHEVMTWPASRLVWHLTGWWMESPEPLIPTDEQVAASVAVLRSRPDADSPEIQDIIAQGAWFDFLKAQNESADVLGMPWIARLLGPFQHVCASQIQGVDQRRCGRNDMRSTCS